METKDYFKTFREIADEVLADLKKQYFEMANDARDWETAHTEFNDTIYRIRTAEISIAINKLGTAHNFAIEWDRKYKLDKSKDRPQIFNELIENVDESKRDETVKLLGANQGLWEMLGFMGEEYRRKKGVEAFTNSNIKPVEEYLPIIWKGDNETEFVQFVYALHEAGYIEHETKEMSKLVEDFAYLFDFPLGENWQINLSTSIHKRNSDYVPKIFDNLKDAYKNFQLKKIEKKKKI